MAKDKAYKILALQEGISNSQAKSMIDRGLVYVGNKKVMIACKFESFTTFLDPSISALTAQKRTKLSPAAQFLSRFIFQKKFTYLYNNHDSTVKV